MKYHEASRDLVALRRRLDEIRSQMREVLAETEPQPVDDQTFETVEGQTSLRELFGRRKDLIFIHNMGESTFDDFHRTIAALNDEQWTNASIHLLDSAWAHQVQRSRVDRIVKQLRDG